MGKSPGRSYQKRVADVNRIYDLHAGKGISNVEIWRRYIYPVYGICERTFYNLLKAPTRRGDTPPGTQSPSLFDEIDD
ncbi:MAG: hypothetical protein HDR98_01055 [Bacteroides sp.]|nr:hypothetical protein [Bacteroides sp.]